MRCPGRHGWTLLAAAVALHGCTTSPPGAAPDCEATAISFTVTSEGGEDAFAVVLVIDSWSDPRRGALADAIGDALHRISTGDADGDGRQDFATSRVLRVSVLDVSGAPILEPTREAPALAARGARPRLEDGWLELWPGEDPTWTAWFVRTAQDRVQAAMDGRPISGAHPVRSGIAWAESHRRMFGALGEGMLIVVTPRDLPGDGEWSDRYLHRFVGGAVIGAIPFELERDGSPPDVARLLADQTFDESDVRCADASAAGAYPRSLLGFAQRSQFVNTAGVGSLCDPTSIWWAFVGADARNGFWPDRGTASACIGRELPVGVDARVDCTATLLLPAAGPARRCAQHGLEVEGLVASADGARERCALEQIVVRDGAERGFVYEVLETRTCGPVGDAIRIGDALSPPPGSMLEGRCYVGTPACGFHASADAGLGDAREVDR